MDPWHQAAYERRRAAKLKTGPIYARDGWPPLSLQPLDDPGRIEKIAAELDRDYPDSLEWIIRRLWVAQTAEEVLQFRVRKSEQEKEPPH